MKLNFLLFCDAAAQIDEGKMIIHGTFDSMMTPLEPKESSPLLYPSMAVAFEVKEVNASEKSEAFLQLHDLQKNERILEHRMEFRPSKKIGGILNLRFVPFKSIGEYRLTLEVNGQRVGETMMSIVKKP